MKTNRITLDEFRLAELRTFTHATGELSNLLREIGLAAKRIHSVIAMSNDAELTGAVNYKNTSGEFIKSLDRFANDELLAVLKRSISCAGIVSEEEDDILVFDNPSNNRSKYVVMFDPVDGSSNCDNCMTVGTIFGVYKKQARAEPAVLTLLRLMPQ